MSEGPSPAVFDAAIAAAQGHVGAGRWGEAVGALERAVAIRPEAKGAWRALGDARRAAGDPAAASVAHDRAARLSLAQPPLADAVAAIAADRPATAEAIVRDRLRAAPTDVAAIVLLATLAQRGGKAADAIRFLRHALDIAGEHRPAREQLARLLYAERHLAEALAEFDRLLAAYPAHPGYRNLRAAILDAMGDHRAATAAYRAMLADDPDQPAVWMTLGNVLKSIGDIPGAVAAFRRSVALAPETGESWWGLANLKFFRFEGADIAAMQGQLAQAWLAAELDAELDARDRLCIDFALGKAFEDEGRYAESAAHYAAGNRRQQARAPHDPAALGALVRRSAALFTPGFFAARAGSGDPSAAPVFIVGMPRSGSTLVEQILASHPAIEGTMELPELPRIVRELGDPAGDPLARLSHGQLRAIGASYLRRAGRWRQGSRPVFIDKQPLNFAAIGLIRLILPNARIIDVRRHPLGCGVSVFHQYFPSGSSFATDLGHIGRFYADYVAMMALWDDRLPGHVHHVAYEDLVTDTGRVVRAMLDHLALPFDPACLAPHANARAVRTPSAEQVRRPIHREAIDHWRHYEPWLAPMKAALGDVLTHYGTVDR